MALSFSNSDFSSLTALNPADVQQLLDRIITQLQELNPSLDLKRGVFKDTVAYYHAVLEASMRTSLRRYQSARSLQQIQLDPTLADDTVVDEVLSNWGVTRRVGTKAIGSITIELSQARSINIPINFPFESNSKRYLATKTFTSRPITSQISLDTDRLLQLLSNGNWAFTIEVEAEDSGASYRLNAGDSIAPVRSITNYVTSYATSNFMDGVGAETNAELLQQLQLGIAAKTLSNRTNMRSFLRTIPAFDSVTNQSIIGYGDTEMLRDRHTVFPVSYGGRVDWYIRGQLPLQRTRLQVTAVCVEVAATTSTWQFSLGKNDVPGFYEVTKIKNVKDAGLNSGFEPISDTRSNDLTEGGFLPDIATVAEGAYSAFQAAVIRFVDTSTSVTTITLGQKAQYFCEVTGTPLIKEIQELVGSRDVRSYAADVLVKAPIPCFVEVTLTINKTAGDITPPIAAIKAAIVNVVNSTDFIGRLDGSRIVDAIHSFLQDSLSVTGLDLFGRIRNPDGTIQYLRNSDSLIIPDQPAKMVTAKTVQFFTEISKITVNIASTIYVAK
jgi:hypothetical protein